MKLSDAELKKLDIRHKRRLKKIDQEVDARLTLALSNVDGWTAIENITDEEWDEALESG